MVYRQTDVGGSGRGVFYCVPLGLQAAGGPQSI
jgi:hypothetical protein